MTKYNEENVKIKIKKVIIMDIIKLTENLIKLRTETGNLAEINKALQSCKDVLEGTGAIINIYKDVATAPVIFITNCETNNFDVLALGHLDVVPATDDMFVPVVENGRLYGRGSLDMKSFAVVALNSMEHVLKNKLPISFGIILSTDEEKGSAGTHAFMNANPDLKAEIVLDNDVGGDIKRIVTKCKNPVFVKIMASGMEAHGSTPWEGVDANENMLMTLANLRKIYPYYCKGGVCPTDTWIDTVHFAKIHGGDVANVIAGYCEALCDFRLTENSSVENLENNLKKSMMDGVTYKIVSESTPVVMCENNPYILDYKKFAEDILGDKIEFEQIGGATDSRAFAVRGSTVIMHSGTGEGMHTKGEYVEVDSVLKIAEIQIKFLEKLALEKK